MLQKPHNPDIARVFYRAGYIESWGRRIQKIRDACKAHGAEEPEYIVHAGDMMVRFKALQSAIVTSKVPNRQDGGLNGSLEITIRSKVIETIRNKPQITQIELVAETAIPLRTIQRVMKELQKDEKIERKGGNYGYWEVVDSAEQTHHPLRTA
jgi:ATP-dependent DNA helicase RecG